VAAWQGVQGGLGSSEERDGKLCGRRLQLTPFLPRPLSIPPHPHAPSHHVQILESSQTLLNVLKREAINLAKKRSGPM
jgi:hypothetical protein